MGGIFALETLPAAASSEQPPRFLRPNSHYFCNATSALMALLERLRPDNVWLPSYSCVSLFAAAASAQIPIRIFEVDETLGWMNSSWLERVGKNDAVVHVDYFGRAPTAATINMLRATDAWIIEDATQAMLNDAVGDDADFVLFSPRKFVGVPDGGVLCVNADLQFAPFELSSPPTGWWLTCLNASLLRREFDTHGGNRAWFQLSQRAESSAPIGMYSMSELSQQVLGACINYEAIKQRRRRNHDLLANALAEFALMPARGDAETPMALPIRIAERDRLRQALFDRGIYPPVHWSLEGFVPTTFAASHRLSQTIMSLPCDHRYDDSDMARLIAAVKEAMSK